MKKLPEPQRLDQLLVALGLFASRSRSRDAIQRGTVKVDGKVVAKPSLVFAATHQFDIDDPAQDYVSRAALKLDAALDHFKLSPEGCHCLDDGASTGGFTEVLLKRGAGDGDRCRPRPAASATGQRPARDQSGGIECALPGA